MSLAELEPLYTAEEMKAAEAGHDVDVLMRRAGEAVAAEALRAFPDARRFVGVCGGGSYDSGRIGSGNAVSGTIARFRNLPVVSLRQP